MEPYLGPVSPLGFHVAGWKRRALVTWAALKVLFGLGVLRGTFRFWDMRAIDMRSPRVVLGLDSSSGVWGLGLKEGSRVRGKATGIIFGEKTPI